MQERGRMQDKKYLLSIAELLSPAEKKGQETIIGQYLRWLDDERRGRLMRLVGAGVTEVAEVVCGSIPQKRKVAEILGAGMLLQLAVSQALAESETAAASFCEEGIIHFTVAELLAMLEKTGKKPLALEYTYGENGKPYFKNYPWHFNLSHSGEYILCVMSEHEVGVDIQQERPLKDDRIARRFFSEEENRALAACETKQERQKLFYRMWAFKEAYGKLTGQGIAAVLAQCNSESLREYIIEEYQVKDYQIAVCKWKQES